MNLFTSKLFQKNKKTLVQESNEELSANHLALFDLLSKGQRSNKSKDLEAEIEAHEFPAATFEKELDWVYFYLKVEKYLLVFDGKYIGSKKILREEVFYTYPSFANSRAFKALMGNSLYQEISISRYFLTYNIYQLSKTYTAAERWNFAQLLEGELNKTIEKVAYIHTLRKLKDKSHDFYNEMSKEIDEDVLEKQFTKAIKTFSFHFSEECNSKELKDFFPVKQFKNPPKDILSKNGFENENLQVAKDITFQTNDVLEHMLDGYLLCNKEGKILQFNTKALHLFGFPKEVFKLMSVFSLFPKDFSQPLKNEFATKNTVNPFSIIGHRKEIEINTNQQTKQYEIAITNNYTSPIDTYSIFLKDISDKKETLKNIKEAKLNAERTAEAKATFLSNMSHEIRTPLNVILGLSEIIKKTDDTISQTLRKNIEGIDFSARNLLAIVNDILDFSKIEAGKLSIQSLDFNIKKIVRGISSGFEIKAQEKGLTLHCEIEKNIPEVIIGDQYRLNQILTNLIGNAIKFTSQGQITIHISKTKETEENIHISFQVKDTGIGIPEDQLQQIFNSFYQVEGTENDKMQGTGLGLTITKELIALLGGKLRATSTEGLGSIFQFEIPFKKSLLQSIDSIERTIYKKDDALKGLKVLVAEDNKMNQFYIKQLLSNLHIEVTIAENGQEALDIFNKEAHDFDMILMDMHMPVMNGIDAIKQIRNTTKNKLKKVPIVMCSADVFPEARKNAIKAGIDFYLTKPLSEEAVKEVLFWLVNDNFTPQVTKVIDQKNETIERNVDIEQLKTMFDNDESFLISLFESFIKETPEDYNALRDCIDRKYFPRAAEVAHKMKSIFMNLGMTKHGFHLQQIEKNILLPQKVSIALQHFEDFKKGYTKALLEVNLLILELKQKK